MTSEDFEIARALFAQIQESVLRPVQNRVPVPPSESVQAYLQFLQSCEILYRLTGKKV